jgi:hypothetical protein
MPILFKGQILAQESPENALNFYSGFLNKYPKNTEITQYLRPINIAVNKWNFANRDKQEPLALLTIFKP